MPTTSDALGFLETSYQAELQGEAFFALMAERERDAARAARFRMLERLERFVAGELRCALEAHGGSTAIDVARRDAARDAARVISGLSPEGQREAVVAGIEKTLSEAHDVIPRLPAPLQPVATLFLQHEQALLAHFEAEAEAEGREADPVGEFLTMAKAPAEAPIPEGLDLIPQNAVYQADPAAVHRLLQRRAPVHRDRQFGGLVVSGHDAVRRILFDLEFFVDPRKAREDDPVRQFLRDDDEREPSMLFLDDPEHKRLRNLVSRSFTPRAVRDLAPVVDRVADELLDAIVESGAPEFDLIEALAAPLPAIAIARILGVDAGAQARFKAWSVAASEAFFNPFADEATKRAGLEANEALDACFRSEIAARRRTPSDDLIGQLVATEEAGDRLSESEIVTMCNLLLIAGNVTTTDLIGNGVRTLLECPEQHAKLRANPALIDNAVEEMLRFDPPVQTSGRIAPRDCEIDGVPVGKGEGITLLLAAANRDPAVYPDPDRFDIEREDTHHHAFGGGAHLCLGAHLARAEARAAIGALVARFPRLRPAGGALAWKQTPGFRGLSEYRVRID